MNPNTRIEKISLINFKNHLNTNLEDLNTFIVLNGKNGSGKTNILEAISLFSPGRGMKNSRLSEIPNKNENQQSFDIKLNIKYETGEIQLSRSFHNEDKNKNHILADNEKINPISVVLNPNPLAYGGKTAMNKVWPVPIANIPRNRTLKPSFLSLGVVLIEVDIYLCLYAVALKINKLIIQHDFPLIHQQVCHRRHLYPHQ